MPGSIAAAPSAGEKPESHPYAATLLARDPHQPPPRTCSLASTTEVLEPWCGVPKNCSHVFEQQDGAIGCSGGWLGHQQAADQAAWIERQQRRRQRLGYMRVALLGDGAVDLAVHEPEVNPCLMLWRLTQHKSTQADLTTAANKEPLAAKENVA